MLRRLAACVANIIAAPGLLGHTQIQPLPHTAETQVKHMPKAKDTDLLCLDLLCLLGRLLLHLQSFLLLPLLFGLGNQS